MSRRRRATYPPLPFEYIFGNYCATNDSVYLHDFTPHINSYGPDIDFCIQSDYTLELENDSLNGSWSVDNVQLPIDSLGVYFFTPDQIGSFVLIYNILSTIFSPCLPGIVEHLNSKRLPSNFLRIFPS